MPAILGVFLERLTSIWQQASSVWLDGGWAMLGIAVIALILFGTGMKAHFALRKESVPEETWRRWIDAPSEREGKLGELLDFVTDEKSLADTLIAFEELRSIETVPIERDLKVMKVFVSAAPLVGLLGTVTGMLGTFGALATGSGGQKTMALVASGISEALITTETGLVIALPGLFFQYQLVRRCEAFKTFLAHLESVCTQVQYRRLREREKDQLVERARGQARTEIARRLARRLRPASTHEPVEALTGATPTSVAHATKD